MIIFLSSHPIYLAPYSTTFIFVTDTSKHNLQQESREDKELGEQAVNFSSFPLCLFQYGKKSPTHAELNQPICEVSLPQHKLPFLPLLNPFYSRSRKVFLLQCREKGERNLWPHLEFFNPLGIAQGSINCEKTVC